MKVWLVVYTVMNPFHNMEFRVHEVVPANDMHEGSTASYEVAKKKAEKASDDLGEYAYVISAWKAQ